MKHGHVGTEGSLGDEGSGGGGGGGSGEEATSQNNVAFILPTVYCVYEYKRFERPLATFQPQHPAHNETILYSIQNVGVSAVVKGSPLV